MAIVTLPTFGADPVSITGPGLDAKVDPLATDYNGNIDNNNIASAAGIVYSKLNLATSVVWGDFTTTAFSAITQPFNFKKGADIASATTTDIGAATGNTVDVTGTTTITGLGTIQAGTTRDVRFTGVLTLTHNGTSLILPTGANITTAAGDCARFVSLGSGNWYCEVFQRKDGTALSGGYTPSVSNALSGSVIQTVKTLVVTSTTGSTALPNDDTIPQNTEGDQYMSLAITPNNASNTLLIWVSINLANDTNNLNQAALFQDSTANALQVATCSSGSVQSTINLFYEMAAGTTSATTFKVRAGSSSGTTTFNGSGGSRKYGGVYGSSITIQEIKA